MAILKFLVRNVMPCLIQVSILPRFLTEPGAVFEGKGDAVPALCCVTCRGSVREFSTLDVSLLPYRQASKPHNYNQLPTT